jgi:predicted unusual protein kinase regulating ubiquinone biosynthesis (AarF/ABC1/UbiB family)
LIAPSLTRWYTQDAIPAFDSVEAMQVIEAEMNTSLTDLFSELTAAPVAAASIAQVCWPYSDPLMPPA